MAYGDYEDLKKRTAADKVLRDKAFNIPKDPKYDGYQRGLGSMVYKLFDKKASGSGVKSMPQNEQLTEELFLKFRKFKKTKVYSAFKGNIWGTDLTDIQLVSKFNKGFRYLFCVIDIHSKYAWIATFKNKKAVSIFNAFEIILNKSNRKPNKIRYG